MAKRGELTNAGWARLTPLLPLNGKHGGQWRDHRQVINGILWRLRVGAPWRDVPVRYGPWQTCYDRFVRWRRDGTWDRLLALVQSAADTAGEVDWTVCVDGTVVRAHQHAAGARQRPSKADSAATITLPQTRRWGAAAAASRRSSTSPATGGGRPLAVVLTPGQRHESTQLGAVLDAIRVPRPGGVAPASGPTTSSPTRATATRPAGGCCAAAASHTPSPSGGTSAGGGQRVVAARCASTPRDTSAGMWWRAA
jgi:transposase